MEIKLVILSLACLSCLVPPAYSTALTAKLAAAGAAKGAALLGAGILAKGAVLKGALLAALAAKGALIGGAALLGAKALKLGAALKSAVLKPLLLPSPVVVEKPVLVEKPIVVEKPVLVEKPFVVEKPVFVHKPLVFKPWPYQVPKPSVVISPPSPSKIVDRLSNLISVSTNAVAKKTEAVGELLASLLPSKAEVSPPRPVVYQLVSPPKFYPAPKFYPVPVFEKIVKKK
ncbi:uncharacterized protein LOC106132523 [Amyelois transitella]|uniref:uncharacterized protein LOC106132523 n=1 Tax=Amyelois transitella TaxID=680683 RepID=UPI00298F8FF3|nr:uncharacterized protein LOC106132523 [Amyelois transitella]